MDKYNLESMLKGIGITEEESTKPNQTKSKRACFDYQKGSCFRGANCRFRHVIPEDIAFEQQQQRLANQRAQQLENSSRSSSKEKVIVCGIYVCMPLVCRLCERLCFRIGCIFQLTQVNASTAPNSSSESTGRLDFKPQED